MMYIHGMGHFHPENVIDNAFLESLNIGTNDQWIMERVGIKRRRTLLPLSYITETKNNNPRDGGKVSIYTDAQTGAKAANLAFERAHLKTSDIGLVIGGTCSAQYQSPAIACQVANELGINLRSYDLNAACSTFLFQMQSLISMQQDLLQWCVDAKEGTAKGSVPAKRQSKNLFVFFRRIGDDVRAILIKRQNAEFIEVHLCLHRQYDDIRVKLGYKKSSYYSS